MSASRRQANPARLVLAAGQLELAHRPEAPTADESRNPPGRAVAADLNHAPEPAATYVDRHEARRPHQHGLGHGRHVTWTSQARTRQGATLMRDWGPVLAAFALCPLLALLAPTDPAGPLARAVAVGDLEATLGLRFEPAAVAWLSDRAALNAAAELFYFWAHLPATVGVLVWVWLERRPAFRPARNAFVLTQAATLVINALLPTAPPSMGLAEATRAAEDDQLVYALQSPFAAMPSGHVAFAVFAAGTLVALVGSWAIRLAAVAYGALVVGVVISTGNHFWLDVAAGSAIAAVAMRATA